METMLSGRSAGGLAKLLALLNYSEGAAAVSFSDMARDPVFGASAQTALAAIALDEQRHGKIVQQLISLLPDASTKPRPTAKLRALHLSFGQESGLTRLARIASLDSGVCAMLGHTLRSAGALPAASAIHKTLRGIQRDEARHATLARAIIEHSPSKRTANLADEMRGVRLILAELIDDVGDAFEALEVDASRLVRAVRQPPPALLRG